MRTVHLPKEEYAPPMAQPIQERRDEYAQKCNSCGACCSYYFNYPFRVEADGPIVGNRGLTLHRLTRTKWVYPDGQNSITSQEKDYMRKKTLNGWPACKALEGVIGRSVSCAAYEERPSACREFDPGSAQCVKVRKWAGFEPEETEKPQC